MRFFKMTTDIKSKPNLLAFITVTLLLAAAFYYSSRQESVSNNALASKFEELSKNGNSSCSAAFTNSIDGLSPGERIQGSCCSPMDEHRYREQVEGLKKFRDIPEIPPDPYDIDSGLARQLKSYYDIELNPAEQESYDYAMANSHEKGPCCCKCWRWYVYGGLGKLLIQKYHFSGQQVTDVWNLSDGCGGAGEHAHS